PPPPLIHPPPLPLKFKRLRGPFLLPVLFSALVLRSDDLRPALVQFAHALFAPRKLPFLKLVHHVCAPALLEVNPSAASGRAPVHRSTPNCRAVISCPQSLQRARPPGKGERQVRLWPGINPCPPSRVSGARPR